MTDLDCEKDGHSYDCGICKRCGYDYWSDHAEDEA